MSTISIRRRHTLDHKAARKAAQKVAKDLEKRYELACRWEGDDVAFERQGITGRMHVGKAELKLDIELSFLLSPLRRTIEQSINKELDLMFGSA